ncbi:competence protein ComK [Virgibacillus sp. L01]|uniref:competence protein ComK n=1 Tax=Virgibacillus sp. L01 TaxID=3457429 RepID=UPI003FD0F85C
MRASCLENGSTYEGKRIADMHHIGIKRKTPILINPSKNIFTFPTHSPTDFAYSWILYSHVQDIKPFRNKPNSKSIKWPKPPNGCV